MIRASFGIRTTSITALLEKLGLKADKYVQGLHGVRAAVAGLKRLGSGHPALQRFRIGLNFALAGHKEVDRMVESHSAMARSLAAEIGLPAAVQEAVAASYEQWDGKGWPGELKGEAVPIAARVSQLAEFVEVAHGSGGVEAAIALARKLGGSQFDPRVAASFASAASDILGGLGSASTWDGVIAAEPALEDPLEAEVLGEAERDPALADHVLHRLAEPEIDAERQGGDELGQANRFEIGRLPHTGVMVGPVEEPWAGRAPVLRPSDVPSRRFGTPSRATLR